MEQTETNLTDVSPTTSPDNGASVGEGVTIPLDIFMMFVKKMGWDAAECLERLARNTEKIHPEWKTEGGDEKW